MTHQRLLDIAVEAFGRNGLDGASTREIAKAAGTAMSSITYHYGSKEGLYLAAAEHVAKQIGDPEGLEGQRAALASGDPDRARQSIHAMIGRILGRFHNPRSDGWAMFVMREQMAPTEAFDRIYAGPMGETARALVDLVALATGTSDRLEAQLTASAVMGQLLILKSGRATCCKMLERDQLGPDVINAYQKRVAANVDAILDRMISERQEQA